MAGYRSLKRVTRAPHGGGLLALSLGDVCILRSLSPRARGALTLGPSACETPQNTHITLAVVLNT